MFLRRWKFSSGVLVWFVLLCMACIITWSRQHLVLVSQMGALSSSISDLPFPTTFNFDVTKIALMRTTPTVTNIRKSSSRLLSNQKILLFITTIFSESHMKVFSCCWPKLMEQSQFLPYVDVMVFANNNTEIPQSNLVLAESVFLNNPSYTVQFAPVEDVKYIEAQHEHNMFQLGANLGPKLAFQNGWFEPYDWIIRINPDVFIRNSTWIQQSMNDPSIEGIFVNCNGEYYSPNRRQLHTDFFAVRPNALMKYHPLPDDTPFSRMELESWSPSRTSKQKYFLNHETTAYRYFSPMIKAGASRYLPDAEDSKGNCRIRGVTASVFHGHDSCIDNSNVCEGLADWNII
ncbi:hypothetical protein IV203_012897 [Nitzschia inconspicua]|uniref:Uncharacterized protein n=1 Tax=Nitzschia inconspicua TaxID=303405 RepID=A0A9K3M4C6_9STRA|nr:hypothetical protein IV203_012897 [Nitzschia inconspicua]